MLKLEINVQQIYLRLKLSGNKDSSQNLYFKIYFQDTKNQIISEQRIAIKSHLQPLGICHIIYVAKSQIKDKKLMYKVMLTNLQQQKENKIHKFVGDCDIELRDFDIPTKQLPIGLQTKVPLKKCRDKQAYLKFRIILKEIEELKSLLRVQGQSPLANKTIQDLLQQSQKQVLLKQQNTLLSEVKQQKQHLISRNNRLQEQISRLKEQNLELSSEVKQRRETMRTKQQLQQDKLDLMIQRNIKSQEEYKKVKENIGRVFNLVNQYGRVDIVEQISNLLAK